ncbi:MAG: hypothetical protein CVV00_12525 [Firmicutes bacterium HGW-Firmicutes-5]|nr:MAG: hypothetical protein CVV00_12525 [Firmicutes bacterium HGW-Firmicutes-5]
MNEGKDTIFKNQFEIKGYKKENNKTFEIEHRNYYNPDLIFTKDENIIICEHSSTGDRKVHLGEMLQFVRFANLIENTKRLTLFILLQGESKSPPTKRKEMIRIKEYVDFLKIQNEEMFNNIDYIGVGNYLEVENEKNLVEIICKCENIFYDNNKETKS